MTDITQFISNVKQKDICETSYGDSKYSNLFYCDKKNKICITFTPRGGCSISFQQYLDLVGLLHDGLSYDKFIHKYRMDIFVKNISFCSINKLINEKYIFIKFIINPYIRAVSIYRAQDSHNLTFREYLKKLISNKSSLKLNLNDEYHSHLQYIDGEENIITKYIKIDKNETFDIILFDGTRYTLNVNKYVSIHHGTKNINNELFSGDLSRTTINTNLPKSYKYFYDDEIKQMVEHFYKKDIEYYGYSFDDF